MNQFENKTFSNSPKYMKVHDSLIHGPEHHLITNAFNLKNKMPPNVLNSKRLKVDQSIQSAISQKLTLFKDSIDRSGVNTGIDQSVISRESMQAFNQNIKKMNFSVEERPQYVWQDNTVKSPFERKPGMKMSTYGGEKRRMSTRYNIN